MLKTKGLIFCFFFIFLLGSSCSIKAMEVVEVNSDEEHVPYVPTSGKQSRVNPDEDGDTDGDGWGSLLDTRQPSTNPQGLLAPAAPSIGDATLNTLFSPMTSRVDVPTRCTQVIAASSSIPPTLPAIQVGIPTGIKGLEVMGLTSAVLPTTGLGSALLVGGMALPPLAAGCVGAYKGVLGAFESPGPSVRKAQETATERSYSRSERLIYSYPTQIAQTFFVGGLFFAFIYHMQSNVTGWGDVRFWQYGFGLPAFAILYLLLTRPTNNPSNHPLRHHIGNEGTEAEEEVCLAPLVATREHIKHHGFTPEVRTLGETMIVVEKAIQPTDSVQMENTTDAPVSPVAPLELGGCDLSLISPRTFLFLPENPNADSLNHIKEGEVALYVKGGKLYCKISDKDQLEITVDNNSAHTTREGLPKEVFGTIKFSLMDIIKNTKAFQFGLGMEEQHAPAATKHYTDAYESIGNHEVSAVLDFIFLCGYIPKDTLMQGHSPPTPSVDLPKRKYLAVLEQMGIIQKNTAVHLNRWDWWASKLSQWESLALQTMSLPVMGVTSYVLLDKFFTFCTVSPEASMVASAVITGLGSPFLVAIAAKGITLTYEEMNQFLHFYMPKKACNFWGQRAAPWIARGEALLFTLAVADYLKNEILEKGAGITNPTGQTFLIVPFATSTLFPIFAQFFDDSFTTMSNWVATGGQVDFSELLPCWSNKFPFKLLPCFDKNGNRRNALAILDRIQRFGAQARDLNSKYRRILHSDLEKIGIVPTEGSALLPLTAD